MFVNWTFSSEGIKESTIFFLKNLLSIVLEGSGIILYLLLKVSLELTFLSFDYSVQ